MGNFNRGGGGNRFGGDRGSNRFDNRGGRPSFSRKEWGNKNNGFDRQMFRAVCGECNKPCEVPFEPREGKIVFCSDCFSTKGGAPERGGDRGGRFERRDFGSSASARPRFENNGRGNSDIVKMVEALSVKIDHLAKSIESLVSTRPAPEKVAVKEVVAAAPVKAPVSLKKEIASAIAPKKIAKKKVVAKKNK